MADQGPIVRPPRPKYQVFISSTFADLGEARKAVAWEVLKNGQIPVGMENFSAQDDRGWKVIRRAIDTTDYYVLIIAGRYGSIDPELGISWTEREYNYAREKGIPIIAFLRETASIRGDQMDTEPEKAGKLDDFKRKISDRHLRETWKEVDDLRANVSVALNKHIREDEEEGPPRPGWYRGNQLPQTVTGEELARLSAENRKLRQRLSELESAGPVIQMELADVENRERHGLSRRITSILAPEYQPPRAPEYVSALVTLRQSALRSRFEPSPQEAWDIRRAMALVSPIGFYFENTGSITAQDVRVEILIPRQEGLIVYDEDSRPQKGIMATVRALDVRAKTLPDHWEVNVVVGKLQAGASDWTSNRLYIGSRISRVIEVTARLFADDLSKPLEFPCRLEIEAVRGPLPDESGKPEDG